MSKTTRLDVLCVGNVTMDAIAGPLAQPPELERMAFVDSVQFSPGGCAMSSALGLARLGFRSGIAAKVGDDNLGQTLHQALRDGSVDTGGLVVDGDGVPTSFTYILLDEQGRRRYFHTLGANARFARADITAESLALARIVNLSGVLGLPALDGPGAAEVLSTARAHGALTCMDAVYNTGIADALELIKPSLPLLDFFVPSVEEAQLLCGLTHPPDMARLFCDLGCGTCVVKLGDRGCYLYSDGHGEYLPAYQVPLVVDTTGAGDAWVSGFLAGQLMGQELPLCALLGNAVAACCVGALGTTAGIPDIDAVQEMQRTTPFNA